MIKPIPRSCDIWLGMVLAAKDLQVVDYCTWFADKSAGFKKALSLLYSGGYEKFDEILANVVNIPPSPVP